VSASGLNPQALWQNVLIDKSCIEKGLGRISPADFERVRETTAKSPAGERLQNIGNALSESRALWLALAAIEQAMQQAGWERLGTRDGLIVATTTGQVALWEDAVTDYLLGKWNHSPYPESMLFEPLGVSLQSLHHLLDFDGFSQLVTTACSASTQAIALAAHWLKSGRIDRCLVGGFEVLSRLTTEGFRSLQLVSELPATPFDEKRAGINLSEAAAFLCLERGDIASPLARLSGGGFANDAHHMTAPHPEGRGLAASITQAIAEAQIAPEDISWVHAHGTGSVHNDLAEANALRSVFGDSSPWVTSTKAVHGHSLAASGALETVICLEALRDGKIPRTAGLRTVDPKIRLRHPETVREETLNHVLKTTLGFGGTNAAIVLSRAGGTR